MPQAIILWAIRLHRQQSHEFLVRQLGAVSSTVRDATKAASETSTASLFTIRPASLVATVSRHGRHQYVRANGSLVFSSPTSDFEVRTGALSPPTGSSELRQS